MARKAGQLISRGSRTWLIRVSLGRDLSRNLLRSYEVIYYLYRKQNSPSQCSTE
jgi:hypothetical protein